MMKQHMISVENGKHSPALAARKHGVGMTLAIVALVLTIVALGAYVVAFVTDPIVDFEYFDAYYDELYESRGIDADELYAQIVVDFVVGSDR